MPIIKGRVTKEVEARLRTDAKERRCGVMAYTGDVIAKFFAMPAAVHPKVGRPRKKGKNRG